ncbi:terminase small subunit [Bdellovibrio bacteriovorus]|uniref:terminase small subunit n=1 Tax=Bdellovibrio bacteriovorus TaxID=959 RepID=UPI003AA8AE69
MPRKAALKGDSTPTGKERPLNEKQLAFVRAFVLCWNATKAAKIAGYSAKTANEQGSRLLANASIRAEIRKYQAEARAIFDITREDLVREAWANVTTHIGDVLDWDDKSVTLKPKEELSEDELKFIDSIHFNRSLMPAGEDRDGKPLYEPEITLKIKTLAKERRANMEFIARLLGYIDGEEESGQVSPALMNALKAMRERTDAANKGAKKKGKKD